MIKNSGSKFDDYSISPKIRQILLHWGYELTEKDFELNNSIKYRQKGISNKNKSLKKNIINEYKNENEK